MFHWVVNIVGIVLLLFLIFYGFIIICSLIENTGYKILSIIMGICHAASPAVFLFFGYQCLLRKIEQYGLWKAILGIAACLLVYIFIIAIWEKIVLGDVPPTWAAVLLTAAQVVITGIFVYGFLFI